MDYPLANAFENSLYVGSIMVCALIPSTTFTPGHYIPITVSVAKGELRKVRSIEIKLIHMKPNSSRPTQLCRFKSDGFISTGNVTYEMDLMIPKKIKPTMLPGNDERRYEIWISVKVAGLSSCRLRLPVRIEAAAGRMKGRILEADNDELIPMFAFK